MDLQDIGHIAIETLHLILLLSAPALLVSLVVGLIVGFFQVATQIQEITLSFVPKLLAVGLVLVITGAWMGHHLIAFASALWTRLP